MQPPMTVTIEIAAQHVHPRDTLFRTRPPGTERSASLRQAIGKLAPEALDPRSLLRIVGHAPEQEVVPAEQDAIGGRDGERQRVVELLTRPDVVPAEGRADPQGSHQHLAVPVPQAGTDRLDELRVVRKDLVEPIACGVVVPRLKAPCTHRSRRYDVGRHAEVMAPPANWSTG